MSDYWNEAAQEETGPKVYFGQIFVEVYPIRFAKGQRKVPFDPQQHSAEDRRIQIKIDGVCNDREGKQYTIPRAMISTVDPEWDITEASATKLGVGNPSEKWACWEMVESGRTYTNNANEIVKKTAFKFSAFYADEAACEAAKAAHYNRSGDGPAENLDDTMPMPKDTPVDTGPTRAELAGFLPMFWTLAGENVEVFYAKIAGDDALKNTFDSNSPEVVEIIGGAA